VIDGRPSHRNTYTQYFFITSFLTMSLDVSDADRSELFLLFKKKYKYSLMKRNDERLHLKFSKVATAAVDTFETLHEYLTKIMYKAEY
jgi:hypothetical protein